MNILFTNSSLVPFLIFLAMPLLIHIFSRVRPPEYIFSSIRFLKKAVKANQRIRKPRNLLLLILRTLLTAALVLVFLKPVFFSRGISAHSLRNIVIIVDATASMAYVEGARTRFAAACAEASEIIGGLGFNDRANIIWMKGSGKAVFPEPGKNLTFLKHTLREAEITSEQGSVEEAVKLSLEMLSGVSGSKEIYLVSDFQKTNWEHIKLTVPDHIRLYTIKTGTSQASNIAVTRLMCDPPWPIKGESVSIHARIMNFSGNAHQTRVYLKAGPFRQSRLVTLNPWNKTDVLFKCRFNEKGQVPVTVQMDEEGFSGDNERHMILDIKESLRAGILPGEKQTAGAWHRALSCLDWVIPEYIGNEPGSMNDMDIVMLSGWDGEHSEKIKTLFNNSGLIFLHPGNGFKLSGFNSLFSNPESKPWAGETFYWQSLENPLGLRVTAPSDNVFKIFGDGEYGDPGKGLFHGRYMVPPFEGRPEDLLISYEDDVPALVRFSDPGIIYFWNIPLGENFSNWAKQLEYLPLLAEMIIDARAKCSPVPVETGHMPGDLLTCLLLYDTSSSNIELYSKDKKKVPTEKDTAAERGVKYVSIPVLSPGIYTWQRDHMAFEYDAVNFPSAESDLRTMTPGEIQKTGWDRLKGGYQARDLHEGISVWPYLLALAAGLALLEGFMAFKLSEIE